VRRYDNTDDSAQTGIWLLSITPSPIDASSRSSSSLLVPFWLSCHVRWSVGSGTRESALALPWALPSEVVAEPGVAPTASAGSPDTRDGDGDVDEADDWELCRCKLDRCLRAAVGTPCTHRSLSSLEQQTRDEVHLKPICTNLSCCRQ
jgi:hypothetical protein